MKRKLGRKMQVPKTFGRRAEALAKKTTALRREQAHFEAALQKWARKNRIQIRRHKITHSAATGRGKGCSVKIREGGRVCYLINETRSSTGGRPICEYRCFKVKEPEFGDVGDNVGGDW